MTVGVVAGLLTVALCHYLGVARLSLMLAFLIHTGMRCLVNRLGRLFERIAIFRPNLADSPFLKLPSFQVLWESWRQQTAAVIAGPISASKFSTVPVAFQVDPLAQPGTVTLYLGANRGRGQAYPNGDISNVVVSRSEAVGLCPGSD